MTNNIYAIYDDKAESYNSPFPLATDGLAVRSFTEATNDQRTDLYKYPGDFKLYLIATWDNTTGAYTNVTPPKYLATNLPKNNFEKWAEHDDLVKEAKEKVEQESK